MKNTTKEGWEIEVIISDIAINNGFKIGSATDLEMIITDINDDIYQADVFLCQGWLSEELNPIIVQTILNIGYQVKSLKATIKGVISQN